MKFLEISHVHTFHSISFLLILFFSGATEENGAKKYLLKWKNGETTETKDSEEVKLKWPHLLVDFLQKRIKWNMPSAQGNIQGDENVEIVDKPNGTPSQVVCRLNFRLIAIK